MTTFVKTVDALPTLYESKRVMLLSDKLTSVCACVCVVCVCVCVCIVYVCVCVCVCVCICCVYVCVCVCICCVRVCKCVSLSSSVACVYSARGGVALDSLLPHSPYLHPLLYFTFQHFTVLCLLSVGAPALSLILSSCDVCCVCVCVLCVKVKVCFIITQHNTPHTCIWRTHRNT